MKRSLREEEESDKGCLGRRKGKEKRRKDEEEGHTNRKEAM